MKEELYLILEGEFRDMSDWQEWSRHVLIELERLDSEFKSIREKVTGIMVDYAKKHSNASKDIDNLREDFDKVSYDIKSIKNSVKEVEDSAIRIRDSIKESIDSVNENVQRNKTQLSTWTKIWLSILTAAVIGVAVKLLFGL